MHSTMEAIQSYFIRKRQAKDNHTVINTMVAQCVIRAMRSILEHDDVRNRIIFQKFPKLEKSCKMNSRDIFDISQNQCEFVYDNNCECDDTSAIINALDEIHGNVVIPIKLSNIYQYIIIDKTMMDIYTIDPTDRKNYVSNPCNIIAKFFQHHKYHIHSVLFPITKKLADPFSQTWSLMILAEALDQIYGPMKCIGMHHYPETRPDRVKFSQLLQFYKDIVKNNPDLHHELQNSFIETVNHYKPQIFKYGRKTFEHIIELSPIEIILSLTLDDIILLQ